MCLFFVFGARMLNESRGASNAASDELEEVEAELSKKQATYAAVGTQDTVRIPRALVGGEEGARATGGRAGGDTPKGGYLVVLGAWW